LSKSILYGLTDADQFVYHYTKASTLTDYILPTNKLRLSRFQNVNDPRESKDWEFNIQSTNWDRDVCVNDIKRVFNRHLKHDWRVGCFVSDVTEAVVTKAREDAGADMLATLYERGYSRPRMWDQYAEGYKGACLIFDRYALDQAVREAAGKAALVHAERVKYQNPPVVSLHRADPLMIDFDQVVALGEDEAARLHTQKHYFEILFVKARDWEAEREFRWTVNETKNEELFVDIADSLVGIVVGDLCTNDLKRTVGRYALQKDLEVAQMGWRNGVPQPQTSHPRLFANAS